MSLKKYFSQFGAS